MLKLLYPYEYADSVFAIDYQKLYEQGFRGIIFDIDNTLVHHGDPSNPRVDKLFSDIQGIGFKTLLLSNNGEKRVNMFLENIDSLYICNADKPKKAGFKKAVEKLELDKSKVLYIGDQIFIDIFGANRCKIANILVKFITVQGETYFGKRRELEARILKHYGKSRYVNRLGDILLKEQEVPYATK